MNIYVKFSTKYEQLESSDTIHRDFLQKSDLPHRGRCWGSDSPDEGLEVTGESLFSLPKASVWVDRSELLETCCPVGLTGVWCWRGLLVGSRVSGEKGELGWNGGRARMGWNPGASVSIHLHIRLLRPSERCGLQTLYESHF